MGSKVTLSSWLQKKKKRETKNKIKVFGNHEEFLSRINKTLCYGKLPKTDRFSLPVTELAAEIFTKARFPGNGVHLRLRPGGKVLGLERLGVAEAGEISRAACISPCSLVLALIYVDRLRECNQKYLEKISPSKLFVVSMMIASKFLHDDGEDDEVFNDEWAASSGIDETELNSEEREFLTAIDWRVNVYESQFWKWLEALEEAVAFREGHRKGWFSYSDLNYLLQSKELLSVVNTLVTVSAVCLTSYTAGVLTLLGSTIIVSSLPSPATLLLQSLQHTSFLAARPTPVAFSFQTDFGNISESCLAESIVDTTSDCSMNLVDELANAAQLPGSHVFMKGEQNKSQYSMLNLFALPKINLPEIKVATSFFNCVNFASRLLDSLFSGGSLCTGLLNKSSKQDGLLDLGFCIQFFNKNFIIGENMSRSFQIFSHFWKSGTQLGLEEEQDCYKYSQAKNHYVKGALSIPTHSHVPLEASQY